MMPSIDRRSFLKLLGTSALFSATGCDFVRSDDGDLVPAAVRDRWTSGAPSDRVLVIVELQGGNDGLSTLVPYGDPRYRDLRPNLGVADEAIIDLDGRLGLNNAFTSLYDRGVGLVAGIGTPGNTLSHFQMLDRWWTGDPEGRMDYRTGFLGRCCDALAGDEPVTGVSLGWTPTPSLQSARARTAALPNLEAAATLFDGDEQLLRTLYQVSASTDGDRLGPLFDPSRRGMRDALVLADFLQELAAPSSGYPDSDLGLRLAAASRLIRTERGIRIIHVPAGHDFDTHDDQATDLPSALIDIDRSIAFFLDDLEQAGFADRVLVATTSEFGRRVAENNSGTDHGNASVAIVAGQAARPGLHGQQPSLVDLDSDGNLRPNLSVGDYFATLAETWLGIPRGEVLPSGTTPVAELLNP